MIGTLGTPEMIFIFILALVLFGPKKLPELGRTVGKALTEFRRASAELKTTFDRELKTLEAETNLKEVQNDLQLDTYNYDYSSYEHTHDGSAYDSSTHDGSTHEGSTHDGSYVDGSYVPQPYESTADNPPTESASATQDAESPSAIAPEGVIARGTETGPLLLEEHPSGIAPTTVAHTAPAEQNA
jgi:sec-independent protein translocase protein TatA